MAKGFLEGGFLEQGFLSGGNLTRFRICQAFGFVGGRIIGAPYEFSATTLGIGEYVTGAVGWRVLFYDKSDKTQKIGELSSDIGEGRVTRIKFTLAETGCGSFRIDLAVDPLSLPFTVEYNQGIEICLYHDITPWYAGYITQMPVKGTTRRPWTIGGSGYFNQLEDCLIKKNYTNTEISDIVRDLVDTTIEEKTDIMFADHKVIKTSYKVKDIRFKYPSAKKAINQLAELAQDFIFGVDHERELFFRGRSSEVNAAAILFVGKNIQNFPIDETTDDLANRIIVRAGKIADTPKTPIRAIVDDGTSQLQYGLREKVMTADFIRDDDDAKKWGRFHLNDLKSPKKKAKIPWVDIGSLGRIDAYGKARIITREYHDPVETEEQVEGFGQDPVTWLADPSATRTCDTSVYQEGGASYKFDWSTVETSYFRMYRVYPQPKDWTLFKYVRFWIKPHFPPATTFKFEFGEAAHGEQSFNFSATMLQWNEIQIDISSVASSSRESVKYVRISWEGDSDWHDGTCWLDDLRGIWYVTNPVIFELAIKKASYSVGTDGIACSLQLGTPDPTMDEIIKKILWKIDKHAMMQDQVISQI